MDRLCENAKTHVADYVTANITGVDNPYSTADVNVIFMTKVLNGAKIFLTTRIPGDGLYEIVYHGDRHEFYLTVYKHWDRKVIKDIPVPAKTAEDCTDE